MKPALTLLLQLGLLLVLAARLHGNSARPLPLYMMQLYRTTITEDPAGSPAAHTGTEDGPGLRGSDSVTSLMAKSFQRTGSRWSFTFDTSSVSSNHNIQLAELRVRLPAFTASSRVSVDIYHSHKDRCQGERCPRSRRFLGRLRARPSSVVSSSSWKVFNVTGMLVRWLQQPSASKPEEEPEAMEEPQGGASHPPADRVMMVIFFKPDPNPTGRQTATLIRTAEHSKYVILDRKQGHGSRTGNCRTKRHHREQRVVEAMPDGKGRGEVRAPLCTRVDMWVDFMQLGWSEWIVTPKWYNSYRCEGSCPVPLDETFTTTNHAYMQSLLKHYRPDQVPSPSCVPTRLAPLSMLYFENGKMITKHHENMVVEECGCY